MPAPLTGQAGPSFGADGAQLPVRQGRLGEIIISELHGKYYEQGFRGNLYSGGMTLTSISNATFTTATLGATCTPIAGIWNPATNTANIVLLQVTLQISLTALQNTGGGAFMWATSVGNAAITTGNNPFNRKTFLASGSGAKDMSGVALTGLTTNLVVRSAAPMAGGNLYNIASLSTAAGFTTSQAASVEFVEGAWVIPPGGVLALLCTTTPVAHSAAAGLLWEEVPIA
jgi:hypothetical protein